MSHSWRMLDSKGEPFPRRIAFYNFFSNFFFQRVFEMINISTGQRGKKNKIKVTLQDPAAVCACLSVWEMECVGCLWEFCKGSHMYAYPCMPFSLCAFQNVFTCARWRVCTVCFILPEGSFKNTLCQILDGYCIIWQVCAQRLAVVWVIDYTSA